MIAFEKRQYNPNTEIVLPLVCPTLLTRNSRNSMICIGIPCGFIISRSLIPPHIPSFAKSSCKQFYTRALTTRLNNRNHLVRLSAMLSLHGTKQVNLRSCRIQSAVGSAFFLDSKKQKLRDISEIKPDASAVRLSVFSDFFPHNIRFIVKTPRFHYCQSIRQKRVWNP